jgi:dipeptidyl aminopeptidase/acylaminoacyl peptidase
MYLESGHVVFTRGNTVLATGFDLQRRTVSGDVTALEAGLSTLAGPAELSLSGTGTLAYLPPRADEYERKIVVVDADGRVTPFIPQTGRFVLTPSLHQDGSRAVVTVLNPTATYELWVADASRASLRRLVALPAADASNAVWSPDRQSVAYVREGLTESDGIYIHRVDGTVEPRRILGNFKEAFYTPESWLPDGSGLIVTRGVAGAGRDLLLVPVAKDGGSLPPRPLRATPHEDDDGVVSPDSRLIAFSSNESGRKEMYVATYDNGSVGLPLVISDGVCSRAEWAGPRRLVYCATPGVLKSVEVTASPVLSASPPVMLNDLRRLRISNTAWTLRSDGRVLGLQRSESEDTLESINVVLGWGEDVKRRLTGKVGK